ncbi:MAG: hypothetical protein LBJ12_03725 [Oscillospiraceae bacterium]|nr:hypothetical protein [Oscillospiraceae bacterium]
MQKLIVPLYSCEMPDDIVIEPVKGAVESWHWESAERFRPKTQFKVWAVRDDAIYVQMWSCEQKPRQRYTKRDQPVYEDSCLEVFLQPSLDDMRYLNFEANPLGSLWSAVGEGREGRIFLKKRTKCQFGVVCLSDISCFDFNNGGWGIEFLIPIELLRDVFGQNYTFYDGMRMRGNFYKCGDKTKIPHWGAWNSVTTNPPGFHNPACFGEIILQEVRQ